MKAWKRSIIYGVSLACAFFLNVAIDLACGPQPDPYDYYISFFKNNLQGGKGYRPFYYTTWDFYYDDNEPLNEWDINVSEWAAYLKTARKKDIKKVLYELDNRTDSVYFRKYSPKRLPDSLKRNTFVIALNSRPQAQAYFAKTKYAEPLVGTVGNRWNIQSVDSNQCLAVAKQYLKMAGEAYNNFVKLRCYYQAQRTLHYGGNYKEAMAVYDKHSTDISSQSRVKGWMLALKAGEEFHLGHKEQSAYLFSKVFALYPERRIQAYQNYFWTDANLKKTLKLARSNRERAFIYAIEGFHTPGLDVNAARRVYQADPSSNLTGVLLGREINKLENTYLTPRSLKKLPYQPWRMFVKYVSDSTKRVAAKQVKALRAFCTELSTGTYPEPALGNVAGAYLDWMAGNTAKGISTLKEIDDKTLSRPVDEQRQMISLLLQAQQIKSIDRVNGKELLKPLNWLDEKVNEEKRTVPVEQYSYSEYKTRRYGASKRDFYQYVLAPAYLKQRDTLRAALAILKSEPVPQSNWYGSTVQMWQGQMTDFWGYYLHSEQIYQAINWKLHKPADKYLAFLTGGLAQLRNSDLYELLGTAYLREHKFSKAVTALAKVKPVKQINKNYRYYLAGDENNDVFLSSLDDYPKPRGKKKYSKLAYARAMANLEKQVKQNPKNAAKYYYLLANGYYNVSYYGNSWFLTAYTWFHADYSRRPKYYYDYDYIQTKTAERYYLKARALSKNQEFKAHCTFMAAKCKQKQFYYPSWDDYMVGVDYYNTAVYDKASKRSQQAEERYDAQVRSNPYFKELSRTYAKTKLYKTAVNECSYLHDFIYGRPKPVQYKVIVVD